MSQHMYLEPTERGIFIYFNWSLLLSSSVTFICVMDHYDVSTVELHFGVLAGGQLVGAEGIQAPAKPSWPYLCL